MAKTQSKRRARAPSCKNKWWDFCSLGESPFFWLVVGTRNTGKSYLVRDVVYELMQQNSDRWQQVVVFTRSLHSGDDHYQSFVPGNAKYDRFEPKVLWELEEVAIEKRQEGENFEALVIFDDCIGNSTKYADEILQIAARGRHVGISCIFIAQSVTLTSTEWRDQATHVSLFPARARIMRHMCDYFIVDLLDDDLCERASKEYLLRKAMNELKKVWCRHPKACACINFEHITWRTPIEEALNVYVAREWC